MEEEHDDVVDDLEDGDEAAAHGQAQDAAHVGDEPDDGHPLVALDLGHCWVLDVDVHQGQVLAGVPVQEGHQLLGREGEETRRMCGDSQLRMVFSVDQG